MTVADALRRADGLLLAIGRSRVWLPVALILILIPYAVVSLEPFSWSPPREVDNGATWSPSGTLAFAKDGLAVTPVPPPWLGWVKRTNQLQVDLRVRSFGPGGGKILTISKAALAYNLTVQQRGRGVIVGVRTACHLILIGDWTCHVSLYEPDALPSGTWVDLTVQIMPGRLRLLIGESRWVERDLPAVPLKVWDEGYRLALGSEVNGSRGWLGEVAKARVRTPGFVGDYVDPGKLEIPASFRLYGSMPRLVPFEATQRQDLVRNALMYAPMGVALALFGLWPGRLGVLRAVLVIGLISLSMETAQLFISSRNPSVTDLILNVVGGAMGFLAFRWFRKALAGTFNLPVDVTRSTSR